MTKDLYDKEIKWKNCLFRNRCPILDLNNGLLHILYCYMYEWVALNAFTAVYLSLIILSRFISINTV